MRYGVIIAGGKGVRLWPLSREAKPKQLLNVIDGQSLLQLAYARLAAVLPPEQIYVCTAARDCAAVLRDLPDLSPANVVGEPVGRDTVNAIGLCCAVLGRSDPEAVLAFVTADHVIEPVDVFASALARAFELADSPRRLVTFGVVPTFAHTGLGYIERGSAVDATSTAYEVTAFVEKPDAERARAYVESGNYLWNSGMFVWRADTLLDQLAVRMPETARRLVAVAQAWDGGDREVVLASHYARLAGTSIDYAVMEPASTDVGVEVVVVPLDLDWIDVGSWTSLATVLPRDAEGNSTRAMAVLVDSAGNIVVSDDPDRLVATIGLHDMVVVHTADVTLVCPTSEAGRLKELVAEVARETGKRFL